MSLPTDHRARKAVPIASGFLDYFPDAVAAVAEVSRVGNEQHHPGTPLHWDRSKSTDEADALIRHFMERGTFDTDGLRHSAKAAWRALALLQKEIECAQLESKCTPLENDRTVAVLATNVLLSATSPLPHPGPVVSVEPEIQRIPPAPELDE